MVQTAPVAGFANTGLALLAGLAGLVPLAPVDALAQGFPTRPVRIIDAFPAGGAGDVIARILSPRLGEALGQTVIVENRPGAGGNIGAEVAAKAPADGHTMFMGVSVVLAPSRSLYANLPYDALRDFMPVSRVGTGAYLLASHPSLPVKTVKDVVALARAKPGALNYASGGIGSGQHLAGELFKSRTGSALTHVAYKGGPPAVAAVAAGESEIGFVTVTAGLGQVNAGPAAPADDAERADHRRVGLPRLRGDADLRAVRAHRHAEGGDRHAECSGSQDRGQCRGPRSAGGPGGGRGQQHAGGTGAQPRGRDRPVGEGHQGRRHQDRIDNGGSTWQRQHHWSRNSRH
jgi:tripartite-type tricarboxylate transporter receptor subunit TctC